MLKFLVGLGVCLTSVSGGFTGPDSWANGVKAYFGDRNCKQNSKCWASSYASFWPGSDVKYLRCDLSAGEPGNCDCKDGYMDADNDPLTGCELEIDEATCSYGTCENHGAVVGESCSAWGEHLKCEVNGCCVLQEIDTPTESNLDMSDPLIAATATCADSPCPTGSYCSDTPGKNDPALLGVTINHTCRCYNGNSFNLLTRQCETGCACNDGVQCVTVTESDFGGLDYEACVCDSPSEYYNFEFGLCTDFVNVCEAQDLCGSGASGGICVGITNNFYLPTESSAHQNEWECNCGTVGYVYNPNTKVCECDTFNARDNACVNYNSGSCDSNPCDSSASCVILPPADHVKVENNVYLDYMCVCPSGEKFDYSSGSCQSENDPLLCNCESDIANCMWLSADLGFYCGCRDGGVYDNQLKICVVDHCIEHPYEPCPDGRCHAFPDGSIGCYCYDETVEFDIATWECPRVEIEVDPSVVDGEVDVIATNDVGDTYEADTIVPTSSFSFGLAELIAIAPKDSKRFFSGFNYEEAKAKCALFGAHLPILGNDNDKTVMWDFMQMVLPGDGYWTHYATESLLNEPFVDQNGNPTKWSIKYSNETAQGDPACTAWYTNDDLGQIHYDQNQCHVLEVDCSDRDSYMTICMKLPASYAMPDIPCPVTTPLNTGECFSGNWTQWYNNILTNDESVEYHVEHSGLSCTEVSSVDVQIVGFAAETYTTQTVEIDENVGFRCNDAENPLGCYDYKVRFCCEGCCSKLNVSGTPEVTDYYENYPGIYEIIPDEEFNGYSFYRKISGYDEVGEPIYGDGYIYYWGDVGWMLGANMFTYSYYSDGIGQTCPEAAPNPWINEVFGTQINVECLPVYPSCNDVECVENAICSMEEGGPMCVCEDGFVMYEDGKCIAPTDEPIVTDGVCEGLGVEWTNFIDLDDPDFGGDWELLENIGSVCDMPIAIEAARIDELNTDSQVVHIEAETGFWCINDEQTGVQCQDWKVRFCCKKYLSDECTAGNQWSTWKNSDDPSNAGDFETISSFSDVDVCSSPSAVEARVHAGSPPGSTDMTHIDNKEGFWCINDEQPDGQPCADFEARFCCPGPILDPSTNYTHIIDGSCDDLSFGWSSWLNSMDPFGDVDGDFETLDKFGRILTCENPTAIKARTMTHPGGEQQIVHINKEAGFWCLNDENSPIAENPVGGCFDWEVSFCCPRTRTGDCSTPHHSWTGWYNDEWNKMNERLWVSAREEKEELIAYGDGAACAQPAAAEIRVRPTGSTTFQQSMDVYAQNLLDHLTPKGYHCINEEQEDGYKCVDMEIRYCCPDKFQYGECKGDGYEWTEYFNSDDATQDGDWELINSFASSDVCKSPIAVQANNLDPSMTVDQTHINLEMGFYCLNSEQASGVCPDFEVRFCCNRKQVGTCDKKGYEWTSWLSRDTPADSGDWEMLHAFEPNEACSNPTGVKVMDIGGDGGSDENFYLGLDGYFCLNDEQSNGQPCTDHAISFCCPVDEIKTCETIVCDNTEFCHETSDGPKCKCGDDDFNVDADDEDFIRDETGACMPLDPPPSQKVAGECVIEVGNCDMYGHEWSALMNTDDPWTDAGDFELLKNIQGICAHPTGIRAVAPDSGNYGSWPVHIDLDIGFWCINGEQTIGGGCEDFQIQVCCPKFATGDCDVPGYSWTNFYDNDNPDGVGDWETRSDLMCGNPSAIQVITTDGSAFDDIIHMDTELGFWCINEENSDTCKDYQVSYCCPETQEGTCSAYGHAWTQYYDKDDPVEYGDIETIEKFSPNEMCDVPTGIRVRENDGTTSDAFTRISIEEGFVCVNDAFNQCSDWEVSFCCPKWGSGDVTCDTKGFEWTDWMNNDHPENGLSTGDWETINSFGERSICGNPTGVQAYPIDRNSGSTAVTHIDESIGFWCVNDEQTDGLCADFAVRFCCPKYQTATCDGDDHEWTDWLDRDDPVGDGDYENRQAFPDRDICDNPTSIDARARSSGSTAVTHIDLYHGFWCLNDEQPNGKPCADFEVRFCCPRNHEAECDAGDNKVWSVWIDSDDPVDSGDWENRDKMPANMICMEPSAIEYQVKGGGDGLDYTGSTDPVHVDPLNGFWCINDEQPRDHDCADFEVRFCCPTGLYDPCVQYNMTCGDHEHIVYDLALDTCGCECDEGYLYDATDPADPFCYLDESCVATNDQCVDFEKCININGHINVVGDADCIETSCTAGYTGSDPETDGFGYEVSCTESGSYLSSTGTSGFIACNCDGKNPCEWESDDITGEITEDDICITDSTCPITEWINHDGLNDPSLHRFINDPLHNTLQADLYDSSKAEVLGQIKSSSIAGYANKNWSNGHYLVIQWETPLPSHILATPYGDYYDPASNTDADSTIQVWETFINHMDLRDGTVRDATQNIDVVLDIQHKFNLDVDDISQLLRFRIAMIPKSWEDAYGDDIMSTAGEIAHCLNSVLDSNGLPLTRRSWKNNPEGNWTQNAQRRKDKRQKKRKIVREN